MAENRIYAYCRVSKNDGSMTIANQTYTIEEYAKANSIKISAFYKDECKGDTPVEKRAQLPVLLDNLREGDTVIVVECSRLHRSCAGLEQVYREIVENKGCEFITLDEKEQILCTNGSSDDLMQMSMKKIILTVLGTVAEMEKRNIGARTKRALAERKAKGQKLGRPTVELPPDFAEFYEQVCSGEITSVQAMKSLGLKKTSYYKLIQRYQTMNKWVK